MDKASLQQTIRQLTQEAALLAEQARRALLPGDAAGAQPVAGVAAAGPAQAQQGAGTGPVPVPAGGVAAAGPARQPLGSAAAQGVEQAGVCLVRDYSLACSSASAAGSSLGTAWQPGASVRTFECPAASYVQSGGGGCTGDKRRRLASGMLAHCIAAAVAEAAATEAGSAAGGGRHLPTPGKTPKRKHRHLSTVSGGMPAGMAPDAATPRPVVTPRTGGSEAGSRTQLHSLFGAALGGGSSRALVVGGPCGPPAEVEEGGQRYKTFDLIDSLWHGCPPSHGALQLAAASRRRRGSGCGIM